MSVTLFDLVQHNGQPHIVCGLTPRIGIVPQTSWPVEFNEIEDFVAPQPIEVEAADLMVLERGQDRLTAVARLLIEKDDVWQENEHLEWEDVNRILELAAATLPFPLVAIDLDKRSWRIADAVPDDMLALVEPAAIVIATHAIRAGEADISDIENAVAKARFVLGRSDATPGSPAP